MLLKYFPKKLCSIFAYIVWICSPQRSHITGTISPWMLRKSLETCRKHCTYPSAVSNTVRSLIIRIRTCSYHAYVWLPEDSRGSYYLVNCLTKRHLVAGRSCCGHWISILTCDSKAHWLEKQSWIREINWKKSASTPWRIPSPFTTSTVQSYPIDF